MSRILLAWELGNGAGHLASLRPVAEALLARGHRLTFAVQNLHAAASIYAGLDLALVPAPFVQSLQNFRQSPANFAEILMRFGYLDAGTLSGLLRGWRGLIELSGAEVVVVDHAPTALLAARGLPLRCMTFGNPFSVPPPVHPSPNMRPWIDLPAQQLLDSDALVLNTINSTLPKGAPPLAAVHELFDPAEQVFVGLPELDPYGPRSHVEYLGLHLGRSGEAAAQWPPGDTPGIFAYLRAGYPHLETCLAALAGSGARCLIYLVGDAEPLIARYRSPSVVFSTTALDIDSVAAQCDLAVCHSGLGMVTAMLGKGLPMLLLPTQLEQYLLASKVAELGAAVVLTGEDRTPDVAGAIARMSDNPQFRQAAREVAERETAVSVGTMVQRAVARIEALAVSAREHA